MTSEANHAVAARYLAEKLGWSGQWIGGAMPDGSGKVFVNTERAHEGSFVVGKAA